MSYYNKEKYHQALPFAKWLKEQRILLDENKGMQAKRIGIALSELTKLSNGTRTITKAKLEQIAFAYRLTPVEKKEMYIASLPLKLYQMAQSDADTIDVAIYAKYGVEL